VGAASSLRFRWQLGRLWAGLEGRLRVAFDSRGLLKRFRWRRFALLALRDRQQFGHAFIQLRDGFEKLCQLSPQRGILLLKRGDVEHRAS